MSEFSYWWSTSGTPSGDQVASYSQSHLKYIAEILASCHGHEGIAPNYLNALAGSVPGANTVRIASGGALVDGKPYHSDADVDVTIPSAAGGGNTRIDRIVLRASWAGYAIRITRIPGVDAANPTVPALTQISGDTYDIPIYQAKVTTGGVVTLTDERQFARLDTMGIADAAVNAAKMAGTVFPYSAVGDMAYLSASGVLSRIAKGTAYRSLIMNAGATAPTWGTPFVIGYASRTTEQIHTGGKDTWIDITSFSVTINMPVAGTILAFATGTFRSRRIFCDAAIRIVIDGTISDTTARKSCNHEEYDISWVPFAVLARKTSVAAGNRTIKVQLGNVGAQTENPLVVFSEGSLIVIGLPGV